MKSLLVRQVMKIKLSFSNDVTLKSTAKNLGLMKKNFENQDNSKCFL